MTKTINELRTEYLELFGTKALNRFSRDELETSITAELTMKARREENEAIEAGRKANQAAAAIERADLDAWLANPANNTQENHWMRRALKNAMHSLEAVDKAKAKFIEGFNNDPLYAMTWAAGMVEDVASADAGRTLIAWFQSGYPVAGVKEEMTSLVIRGGRCPASSTSPLSNYVETAKTQAMAKLLHCF